ncbi:hypothetical protein [Jiangella rhizosphaerae]|uniref:Uncharacterized protein n=1 Tax=Jiangella rhizosphaerae TaxID=2293569 RepID=A0A418KS00_9ACTN|nr:hypothetical protein [Jiangella rhizosphaerae]RIQ26859.1 hypothetical protein DY240_10280 [Jiangella rhizosphaerae]
MRFDRDTYDGLSDEDKALYLQAVRDAQQDVPPPGEIAPQKGANQEGFEVVDDTGADEPRPGE